MQANKRSIQTTNADCNLKKKLKPGDSTQTNTLYSYFASDRKPVSQPKQASILSFFKREKTTVAAESCNEKISPEIKLEKSIKPEPVVLPVNELDDNTSVNEISTKIARKCPFYKRIEGFLSLSLI